MKSNGGFSLIISWSSVCYKLQLAQILCYNNNVLEKVRLRKRVKKLQSCTIVNFFLIPPLGSCSYNLKGVFQANRKIYWLPREASSSTLFH
ncbi:hypothetical protein GDO81_016461 [Engystomops pustulosus]|uniref:Uncharacterized protein n=1 Tax=Engystomops pustulosus TaxID=76066 RepID=A0AAV7AZZ7_ENGPU|nr:hypothetical protein GDO81_016461 [Engystomops pustulosus]